MLFIKFGNYLRVAKYFLFCDPISNKSFKQNKRLKKNLNQVTGSHADQIAANETVQEPKPMSNGKEGSSKSES